MAEASQVLMRIAHVVPTYPPYRGGVGYLAAEYATRLRARGHDVQVFTPRYRHHPDDPDFVHRLATPVRVGNAAFTPSLIPHLREFDLVHLHYPFFGGAEPVLLGKWLRAGQPLVLSYHMDAVADGARGTLFRLHARLVLPRIVRAAGRVLVSSADYAAHSALAAIGNTLSRVEVHPYAVDTERFHPGQEPALRERLGIAAGDVALLFVSRLDPAHHFKGLPVLLDALARARPHGWRLVVVGDGSQRSGFERQAASLGLAERVSFAGDVSDADLPAYYRAADVHVCPSTAAGEAFSLVTLEAAASGIPTVASSLPGVRTVVVHGETGLHVSPGDPVRLRLALDSLMERPARTALGRAARSRAEALFQWEPAIIRLEKTYLEAAASTRGTTAQVN
jgi:glycosyltransferase involved in cell wall biosynthesis